ncbi:chloramphenicol phosphotransferase [Devosia sp. BK]|uniref:phosphotransferase-like protein n=1 Tax=Devosia sp. BK TaxID=2871706 RepID=UPI002939BC89|nr:chloramphenicol phosphotransferase [Devosia sp. BK]MDV3252319.1 chloramphenicol phosphotransferase [Devosia sp. BK]
MSDRIPKIVILNGAPRSGKSSLVRAIQKDVPGTWLNLGVDSQMASLPPHLLPGIGLRPGGERPDLEPTVVRLYELLFDTIGTSADAGFDIIADLGMHEDYSTPLGILPRAARRLGALHPLFIGIDCPIEEIMRRRNAAPHSIGGTYLGGETPPPPVLRWQRAVHEGRDYDLRLDMGALTPEDGAARIAALLKDPPAVPALTRLSTV